MQPFFISTDKHKTNKPIVLTAASHCSWTAQKYKDNSIISWLTWPVQIHCFCSVVRREHCIICPAGFPALTYFLVCLLMRYQFLCLSLRSLPFQSPQSLKMLANVKCWEPDVLFMCYSILDNIVLLLKLEAHLPLHQWF